MGHSVVYPRPDFYLNTFSDITEPKYYDLKIGNISMKRGKCFKPNGSLHEVMGEVHTYIKQCILFHLFLLLLKAGHLHSRLQPGCQHQALKVYIPKSLGVPAHGSNFVHIESHVIR